MRFFKETQDGILIIGTGPGGDEITETEYNALRAEIKEKRELANKLYLGEITIEEIPEAWREEIQAEVNGRKPRPEPSDNISGTELLKMVEEIL